MATRRVLLTGAFGNVGAHALQHLREAGHAVHALDLDTEGTRKARARLGEGFETHWTDLRDADAVAEVVDAVRPDAVLHVAAVIAPVAFVKPELAEAVNLGGTRHLLAACQALPEAPRLVFTSSYTVVGPRNPHRDLPPMDGDTPVDPADLYARHKAEGEALVEGSGLPWTILRLPAVMATDPGWGSNNTFLRFFYTLPPDRREHLLDSRDAGLALANAVTASGVVERRHTLGGPDDCRVTGIAYHRALMGASGLSPLPERAFRHGHPDVDASWYAEDWVDTRPSQEALDYQRHTLSDHIRLKRAQAGGRYWAMRLLGPLIRRRLARQSPYWARDGAPDPTPLVDVLDATFAAR